MKQIYNIAKYITGFAGAISVLYVGFKKLDSIEDKQDETIEQVEYINVEQSQMSEDIWGIKDTLERLERKVDNNTSELKGIERAGRFYLEHQEEYTKDQLQEIMDEILKKNAEVIVFSGPG